jgi:hypothetical protein
MMSKQIITRFVVGLLVLLGIAFPIHAFIQSLLGFHFFGNHIVQDYVFNAGFALAFYAITEWKKKQLATYLGYAFLFSSILKFILFLTLLYPSYKIDNKLKSADFAAFFTPYAICLFYETWAMVKRLKMDDSQS